MAALKVTATANRSHNFRGDFDAALKVAVITIDPQFPRRLDGRSEVTVIAIAPTTSAGL